jgi:glycosyltransferase involved in cell wall biosynthesis
MKSFLSPAAVSPAASLSGPAEAYKVNAVPARPPELVCVTNSMPWFGRHTGYERLTSYLDPAQVRVRVIEPRRQLPFMAIGKLVSTLRRHGRIAQDDAFTRAAAEAWMRLKPKAVAHLLYGEMHLPYWRDAPRAVLDRSVLTVHQPLGQLEEPYLGAVGSYRHILLLWQRELAQFQHRVPNGKVHFIHHGVDSDYFCPGPEPAPRPPEKFRLLYAGVHLRNTAMLARIVRILCKRRGDVQFDLLVPEARRGEHGLKELAQHPNVVWHAGLNDDQLRELYRQAYLLVLPMDDSGANTAVVEPLSCGVPPVTTDVGGIRDYGGGSVYPVVGNNDDDAMIHLIESYLSCPALRDETSAKCRAFAEQVLAWPLIARKHVELYREIAEG